MSGQFVVSFSRLGLINKKVTILGKSVTGTSHGLWDLVRLPVLIVMEAFLGFISSSWVAGCWRWLVLVVVRCWAGYLGQGWEIGRGKAGSGGLWGLFLLNWVLCYVSSQFWYFPEISLFSKILNLRLFGDSWYNSCTKIFILDIKFCFTCGESNLY